MDKLIFLVIAMAIVTYLPRMLPMVLLSNIQLPPYLHTFFEFIPFAALGALIFPGILSSTGSTDSAMAGCIVAIAIAYCRLNLMFVVIGGILGVFVWEMFF
ncbi:AzlD domain-containing protein [Desulfofalx alkaliphila]|uniref:AzlD domain-containing protein n=1 Tax=Desulfofalx alkaliphila TaxID=105483 RepID=UPI0004E1EAA1|nr:AzlD domain-containing protein [Desulfofalx alkaliphila]